ncbi:GNAT family N-acetyltransferase [Desulfitobacterium chlororespirans]|uniref:Ribosomal protein S18 acetylase RimI n=1 Tax=Desulfitobacterium chlororespirans DSM 11544 TaxID=1121395 RepID=A0A1M7SXA1_9FIRM|nr:GNAT family N-acetyltransferase [Desulfitobacterium chlororespirans]SHN63117.1 Ribosomal protein S18 acetylase RimI [Desulfitobacterium chlororespirans DSM 11544]
MEPVIREAVPADIADMVRLLKILFSLEADFSYDEIKQRRGLGMILEDGARCIMVAEQNGRVIGMVTAQLLVSTAEGGLSAWVEDLVVEEPYQGQGTGRALLLSLQAWASARGVKRLQLLADRSNTRALEFYEKMSWQFTELICLRTYV